MDLTMYSPKEPKFKDLNNKSLYKIKIDQESGKKRGTILIVETTLNPKADTNLKLLQFEKDFQALKL